MQQRFQVDLKGLIRLLSENLYTNDSVFLRELLQNCVDAIAARSLLSGEEEDAKITVRYSTGSSGTILEFQDNGIGLTEDELHQFLSVIGQSSKRGEQARGSFIGQFGIGLLSCFLVSSQIEVLTCSARDGSMHRWVGHSDGNYSVSESDVSIGGPGTLVRLRLSGAAIRQFDAATIQKSLTEYGFLLEIPIIFEDGGSARTLNCHPVPWRQALCTRGDILEFGEQVFGESFLDAIPLEGEGLKGYAYLSQKETGVGARPVQKIFLKHMLLTENGKGLIPDWAVFVRCIVDADDLTPTASREGFQHDSKLSRARVQIEKCILDYLIALTQYDTQMLRQITSIHNVALKAFALENDRIFKMLFPFLLFQTNKKQLTGAQILNAAKRMPVYYAAHVDDYRRVAPLLTGGSLLINAGYIYDASILTRLPRFFSKAPIKPFTDREIESLFSKADGEQEASLSFALQMASEALEPYQCRPVLRRFAPKALPALYAEGDDGFLQSGFSGGGDFSSFFESFNDFEPEEQFSAVLYLNGDNALIKTLEQVTSGEVLYAVAQILYIQARLAGHYMVGERELDSMSSNLKILLEFGSGLESGE